MNGIKDVVAFVDGRPEGAGILEYALRLSLEHAAHLTGAFVWPPLAADGPAAYARGRAIHELFAHYQAETAERERSLRLVFARAASFGADLLVMGAYGHSRFTEFVFGGATRTALHEAVLPVLMSR